MPGFEWITPACRTGSNLDHGSGWTTYLIILPDAWGAAMSTLASSHLHRF